MTPEQRRGGRSCSTCNWFAPATVEMKQGYFPYAGTCEIRFPYQGFDSHLASYECGKVLDDWCSFWLPNMSTM